MFLANLDIDLVSILSIFPFRQSLISLWNSLRFAAEVPLIPLNENLITESQRKKIEKAVIKRLAEV